MATGKTRAGTRAGAQRGARVAIVRARWNEEITLALERGAIERAAESGATVDLFEVAGSFELPAAVALLADTARYDAVVPLGCLIRGETPHFEYIAQSVAQGLMDLTLTYPTAACSPATPSTRLANAPVAPKATKVRSRWMRPSRWSRYVRR